MILAQFPASAFEGVRILPLSVPAGQAPLWAAYSYGMRNFDLPSAPNHFVAIYTADAPGWRELARLDSTPDDATGAWPDYVSDDGLAQVRIEPSRVWLTLDGGVGAHSGIFDLLSFDGQTLRLEVQGFSSRPGAGMIKDVNGDGVLDAVLDASDYYVFCYACGVARIGFQVYAWDQPNGRMMEMPLQPMLMGQSGHPGRALTNEAVSLAEAGLWQDALAAITQARQASADVQPPFDNAAVDWDYGIIKLHADAMASGVANSGFPLLSNVFYGDYAAAVDLMRAYSAQQLFSADTPLVVGTVAEGWLPELTNAITGSVNSALNARPELAPAYFLRGWAEYLADPAAGQARAKIDVDKAAALMPGDVLFQQAAAFLAGGGVADTLPAPRTGRIQFEPGATSAAVEGRLAGGAQVDYVLVAGEGQRMLADVSSPRGDVYLAVYGAGGQALLRPAAGKATWIGILPQAGSYTVRVFATGDDTPYTLQVSIPARITFAAGATSATVQGNLAGSQIHEYLLRALAGQTMTVTLTSPGSDVLLEIYGIDDGQPLVRVPLGETAWTGKLPGTQDYDIKAVSVGGATPYTLVVVVK